MEAALRLKMLESGSKATHQTLAVCRKLLGNLADDPVNPKFRRVRLANKKIDALLLQVPDAVAMFDYVGFVKGPEFFEVADTATPGTTAERARQVLQELNTGTAPSNAGDGLSEAAGAGYLLSRELRGHPTEVRAVTVLDGGMVATGAQDNVVRLFPGDGSLDAAGGIPLAGHDGVRGVNGITSLCTAGAELVSSGKDGKLIFWDLELGQPRRAIAAHDAVDGMTNAQVIARVRPAGAGRVVSVSWDKTAVVWSTETAAKLGVFGGHQMAVLDACATPDGSLITVGGDSVLRQWAGPTATTPSASWEPHGGAPIRGCAYLDGAVLSVDNAGFLLVTNPADGGTVSKTKAHSSYVYAVDVVTARSLAVTAGSDSVVKIWSLADPANPVLVQQIGVPGELFGLAVDQASGDIVVASTDATARVFSTSKVAGAAELAHFTAVSSALAAAATAELAAATTVPESPGAGAAPFRAFSAAVGLGGGRQMTVTWDAGEEPGVVADRFLAENSLGQGQRVELTQFIASEMRSAAAPRANGLFDYSFPVELDRGGKLAIQWNAGESPEAVADRFLTQHQLGMDNRPDIVNFVITAQGQAGPRGGGTAPPPQSEQPARIDQLVGMGFDRETARQALMSTGWDVERAVMALIS